MREPPPLRPGTSKHAMANQIASARPYGRPGGRTLLRAFISVGICLGIGLRLPAAAAAPKRIDGVVDLFRPGILYVPVTDLGDALDLEITRDAEGRKLSLEGQEPPASDRYQLPDGTELLALSAFKHVDAWDVSASWNRKTQTALLTRGDRKLEVRAGRRSVTEGVTFAAQPEVLYVPEPELRRALNLSRTAASDEESGSDRAPAATPRTLFDGTPLRAVREAGEDVSVDWRGEQDAARLSAEGRELWVRRVPKRVAINLRRQRMRAWEGDRLVLDTRISSGRKSKPTPKGRFTAGPLKARMLISHKYDDAEMPWAVQVVGDVCIHGFPSVPPRAASHGCVRVPLTGRNPARWFWRWITVGTPIRIADRWPVRT